MMQKFGVRDVALLCERQGLRVWESVILGVGNSDFLFS